MGIFNSLEVMKIHSLRLHKKNLSCNFYIVQKDCGWEIVVLKPPVLPIVRKSLILELFWGALREIRSLYFPVVQWTERGPGCPNLLCLSTAAGERLFYWASFDWKTVFIYIDYTCGSI